MNRLLLLSKNVAVFRAARARRCFCASLLALGAAFWSTRAPAQHCYATPSEPGARGFELSLRSEVARFRTARYEGNYEGVFLRGAWVTRTLSLVASLPRYHIVRNGLGSTGFGDLMLEGRGVLAATRDERAMAGALLASSAPTGDSKHDLGMGHFMLAPTAWASLTRDRFTLEARVGYGRAFGGGARHQHAPGTTPIVDPMNHSEFEAALSGVARAQRSLHTRLALYGAAPVPSSDGATRAALSFAGDVLVGQARFSVEAHLPLVGDAFRGKLAAELGFRF